MKKRVLSVLVAVMLVACMFTSAMAATAGLEVPAKVEQGEDITATITMPAVAGEKAATVEARAYFDSENLELKSFEVADVEGGTKNFTTVEDANKNGYIAFTFTTADGSNNISLEKDIVATATFAVKEGVAAVKQFELAKFYIEVINEETGLGSEIVSIDDATTPEGDTIEVVIPCDHKWVVTAEKVEPTCTEAGKEAVETCELCGETKGGKEIAAKGHDFEWVANEDGETETEVCKVCGATGKTREINPDTGDTMMAVLFLGMAAMFVAGIVVVNKARKNA